MIVEIPSKIDHEGYLGNLIKVDIGDKCITCGKTRKLTSLKKGLSFDGSRRLVVDSWRSECLCVESYQECRTAGKWVPYDTPTTLDLINACHP